MRQNTGGNASEFVPTSQIKPRYYAIVLPGDRWITLSHQVFAEFGLQDKTEKRRRMLEWAAHMLRSNFTDSIFAFDEEDREIIKDPKKLEELLKHGIKSEHGSFKYWNNSWNDVVFSMELSGPNLTGTVDSNLSRSTRAPERMRGQKIDVGFANAFLINGDLPYNLKTYSASRDFAWTARKTGKKIDYIDEALAKLLFAAKAYQDGIDQSHSLKVRFRHGNLDGKEHVNAYDNKTFASKTVGPDVVYARYGAGYLLYAIDKELTQHKEIMRPWLARNIDEKNARFAVIRQTLDNVIDDDSESAARLSELRHVAHHIADHIRARNMNRTHNYIMFRGTPYETVGVRYESKDGKEFIGVALLDAPEQNGKVYIAVHGKTGPGKPQIQESGHGAHHLISPFGLLSTPLEKRILEVKDDYTKLVSPMQVFIPRTSALPESHRQAYRHLIGTSGADDPQKIIKELKL